MMTILKENYVRGAGQKMEDQLQLIETRQATDLLISPPVWVYAGGVFSRHEQRENLALVNKSITNIITKIT